VVPEATCTGKPNNLFVQKLPKVKKTTKIRPNIPHDS
jgi:hypothetical protein